MRLDFKSEESMQAAKRIIIKSNTTGRSRKLHSVQESFMLLIKGIEKEDLDNLCKELNSFYPDISIDECYLLTQGKGKIFENNKEIVSNVIFNCENKVLNQGKHMGSNTISDGKINTSSFISHSIYEARVAENLAKMLGANSEKAMTLAILHDYGRKTTHTLEHVTQGFDDLVRLGWEDEAVSTLTHSFINGGRCDNCDRAEEGFYLDEKGDPRWEKEEDKDDVAKFLELYKYDIYDDILNIADLMATDKGIVSPKERIEDIATRKMPDPKNRNYFLSSFINKMNEVLKKAGKIDKFEAVSSSLEDEEIIKLFEQTSKIFFDKYNEERVK